MTQYKNSVADEFMESLNRTIKKFSDKYDLTFLEAVGGLAIVLGSTLIANICDDEDEE